MTLPSKPLLRLLARKWLKESKLGREVAGALPPGHDPVEALLELIDARLVVVGYGDSPSGDGGFRIVPADESGLPGEGWLQ